MTRASDLHVNTVRAAALSGQGSEWGGRTWAAESTVPCLIQESTRTVKAPSGEDVISSTQVHAAPEYAGSLTPGARVVLPPAAHRPAGTTTYVITLDAIITGDEQTDGVVAMCE